MAEAGESKENPFSFKTFVKTKQDTTSSKTKKAQGKQKSKDSAENLRNKNHFKDEAPFPEVDKEGTYDKLNHISQLFTSFSLNSTNVSLILSATGVSNLRNFSTTFKRNKM